MGFGPFGGLNQKAQITQGKKTLGLIKTPKVQKGENPKPENISAKRY